MNANTPKNWHQVGYEINEWVDIVDEYAIVSSITISNNSVLNASVEIRVDGVGAGIVSILPQTVIEPKTGYAINLKSIVIEAGQRLQVYSDTIGVDFFCSGIIETLD